jgi:hypothetical protein
VLDRAGATPAQVTSLQADLNDLARIDANSVQPSYLARSDYSLVLQTALAVGRPMQTPTPAILEAKDGVRAKDSKSGVTFDHEPTLVGTYQPGATKVGYMRIQIIDADGTVRGIGVVDPTGNYSVKLQPLADGVYHLRSQAVDEVGHLSDPSPHAFQLRVATRHGANHVAVAQPLSYATVTRTSTTPIGELLRPPTTLPDRTK